MNRKQPTRIIQTGRLARGSSGQPLGWLQSMAERFRNIRAQIQGIQERLTTPFVDGVPACVSGERTFLADTSQIVTIVFPKVPDATPPVAFTTLTANPIILAGETYKVPITFTPPGVLMAHNLVVSVEAGFTTFNNFARPGILPLNDYRQTQFNVGVAGGANLNAGSGWLGIDPSLGVIQYTGQQQIIGDFCQVLPMLPFLWNIVDEKSGRHYAQDWLPSGLLMNTRGNSMAPVLHNGASNRAAGVITPDSELFEFDTPWLFERDAQVTFLFRPIMDLYQLDAATAQKPWGASTDPAVLTGASDLSGGIRREQATVRVEFHGNRYYERQDVLKEGAYVTDGPEPPRSPWSDHP